MPLSRPDNLDPHSCGHNTTSTDQDECLKGTKDFVYWTFGAGGQLPNAR